MALSVFFLALLAVGAAAGSEQTGQPPQNERNRYGVILETAWEEYGFQNWDKAMRLFSEVLLSKDSSDKQKIQARIGEVFIIEYRAPGSQPERAIGLWDGIIKDLPQSDPLIPFGMMHRAYAHLLMKNPDYARGRAAYLEALALVEQKNSSIGQQIVLGYLSSFMMRGIESEYRRGLVEAEKYIPLAKGGKLDSSLYAMVAAMAGCLGEHQIESDALEAQYAAGVNSRSNLEGVLFKLGRINDVYLRNFALSEKYYRIFSQELPSNRKAHYASLRANELKNGVIESKILEGEYFKSPSAKEQKGGATEAGDAGAGK